MAISKMEIKKKKKSQSENSCVYTNRAKWKTEAITQMTLIQSSRQLKYTENWRYNMGILDFEFSR